MKFSYKTLGGNSMMSKLNFYFHQINFHENAEKIYSHKKIVTTITGEVQEEHDVIQTNKTAECPKSNSRYGIGGTAAGLCTNKYVECEENIATKKECPEGFYFNEKIAIDKYPCQHLINANCTLQIASRTPQVCGFSNKIQCDR